jgi:glycosyltransferase involved in cell wall biosynthesis
MHHPGVSTPVRIATVIKRLHVGGDETRLLMLARSLDKSRFEQTVYVVNQSDEERDHRMGPMRQRYADAGVHVEVLGAEIMSKGSRAEGVDASLREQVGGVGGTGAVVFRLAQLFRRRGVDVVDARLEFGTLVGTLAGRLGRVPVVVSTGYSPDYWKSVVRYPIGQLAFSMLDALITDASSTAMEYSQWRLSGRARLAVIPNGIYAATAERPRAEVRASLGLPVEGIVVGQVARMIPRKGYRTLIRAARHIVDVAPETHFLLCGFAEEPPFRASLIDLVDSLGLRAHVHITDYPGPIGDVLGCIDAFAHVSNFDSSPIAILESMSAGLPSVVSRVGGNDVLVQDGITGLVVPPGDVRATAQALLHLIEGPELRARLGGAAADRYRLHHRPETMARAHEQLFTDLLAARGVPR